MGEGGTRTRFGPGGERQECPRRTKVLALGRRLMPQRLGVAV